MPSCLRYPHGADETTPSVERFSGVAVIPPVKPIGTTQTASKAISHLPTPFADSLHRQNWISMGKRWREREERGGYRSTTHPPLASSLRSKNPPEGRQIKQKTKQSVAKACSGFIKSLPRLGAALLTPFPCFVFAD